MVQIIINADDFGRHEKINAAVEQAFVSGCLRSATLMPGGRAFDDAVAVARRHEGLGVGVHFTLVNGYPILPPQEIPSLVTEDGVFLENHQQFVGRFLSGRISLAEVRRELAAQLTKMQQTGLGLTHVDSHQHMHTLPGIQSIVMELAVAAGIRAVRIPKTTVFTPGTAAAGLGALIGRLGLSTLARLAEQKAHRLGLYTPDHFAGIVAGEAVSRPFFQQIIEHLQPGTTEVMLHPGTDNAVLQRECQWAHDFEAELQAVCAPEMLVLLQQKGIQPVHFGQLVRE